MYSTTNPKGTLKAAENTDISAENRQATHKRRMVAYTLWSIAVAIFVVACFIVHFHAGPWPFDLQTTIVVQHTHLLSLLSALLVTVSVVNDPLISTIQLITWLIVPSIIGLIVRLKGLPAFRWFEAAIFVSFGTAALDGLDGLIGLIVGRPRPSSPLIHIYMPEPFHSFPSGHAENDMLYYGFILFLTFTKPVREWRYRWILIPFQVFAALIILSVGYSRILEGSHWVTDVLGGYLAGAIYLCFLIYLYNHVTDWLTRRRAKKQKESTYAKHSRS